MTAPMSQYWENRSKNAQRFTAGFVIASILFAAFPDTLESITGVDQLYSSKLTTILGVAAATYFGLRAINATRKHGVHVEAEAEKARKEDALRISARR